MMLEMVISSGVLRESRFYGFLKMVDLQDPQITMGFKTKMVIHDLDDLGIAPF